MNDKRVSKNAGKDGHATVVLVVEGGRLDYLSPQSMPFLVGLKRQGTSVVLKSPPGLLKDPVLFTGRYPDSSGLFSPYVYDTEASPFAWISRLGPLARLNAYGRMMAPVRGFIKKATGWLTDARPCDPAWIPPRFLPHFRPVSTGQSPERPGALGADSVFDLCRQYGLRAHYASSAGLGDTRALMGLVRQLRETAPYDLFVHRLSGCAQEGRLHGPHSQALRQGRLRTLDEDLASVHAALSTSYDSWDLVVLSDQGMAPVNEGLDIAATLRKTGVRPGEDYVALIQPTMVALWYKSKVAQKILEEALQSQTGVHMLEEEERRRSRIPVGRDWGDRVFAARPGVVFTPDHLHGRRRMPAGASGYLDASTEGDAFALIASSREDVRPIELEARALVDVFPTLCSLLGLRSPAEQEGRSMVRMRRDTPFRDHTRIHANRQRLERLIPNE